MEYEIEQTRSQAGFAGRYRVWVDGEEVGSIEPIYSRAQRVVAYHAQVLLRPDAPSDYAGFSSRYRRLAEARAAVVALMERNGITPGAAKAERAPFEEIQAAAATHVGLTPEELDSLAGELVCMSFGQLMATYEDYHPTMRVDIDPRYAQLAGAFNKAAELMGQDRHAWTPANTPAERAALAQFGLEPAY